MVQFNGNIDPNQFEKILNKMYSPEWLRKTAADVGYVKRQRKVDPAIMFWILVLGFGVGVQRSIATLRRAYETASAESLVPSAFYDRFSKGLIDFLKECLAHGIADLISHTSLTLSDKLKGFEDLIVADGTVIKLHDKLAEQFPGTRHKAELKIHTAIGITGNTKSIALFSGKTPEIKTIRIGPWIKNHILLFDLGYFKYELFSRIRKNEGYFVSRLSTSANPSIVSVLRTHRGNAIDLAGKKLKDVLPRLKRGVIDVEVEVTLKQARKRSSDQEGDSFETYRPKGETSKATEIFRLIGVLDEKSKTYHLYITNITPEQLSAEDVALLYKARWSIELLFKELKRIYQLDVISSGAPDVVEALVLVAMITLVVSHRILNHMRMLAPEKSARFTPLRWADTFYGGAVFLMVRVLESIGVEGDPFMLYIYFMGEGVDPNVNRKRLLSPWVQAANSQLDNGNK